MAARISQLEPNQLDYREDWSQQDWPLILAQNQGCYIFEETVLYQRDQNI